MANSNISLPAGLEAGLSGSGGVPEVKLDIKVTGGKTDFSPLERTVRREADKSSADLSSYLGSRLSAAFGGFVQRSLTGLVEQQFRTGVEAIKRMDSALASINRSMPMTRRELRQLGDQAAQMAQDMGVGLSDSLATLENYASQGRTTGQVLRQARSALLLSANSGGSLGVAESADFLQRAKRSFRLEDDSSADRRITDVYESLSSSAAMDLMGSQAALRQAIQAVGDSAADSGVSLESYAGLVTAVAERTRLGGDAIGRAFQDIFSRLYSTGGGDPLSTVTEGERAFHAVGVAVREASGDFRPFMDILSDLSGRWNELTQEQRSALAVQAAGSGQSSVFLAAMDSYSRALELNARALNSSGAAEEGNLARMDTMSAKAARLSADMEGIWTDLGDSAPIKGAMDLLHELLTMLDGWPAKILTVSTAVLTLAAAFKAVKKSDFGQAFKSSLSDLAWPETTGEHLRLSGAKAAA